MTITLRSLTGLGGTRTALIHRGRAYTGADVERAADVVAATLAHAGIGQAHRIALLLGNTPEFAIAVVAALKVRASVVLLGPAFKTREVAECIRRTRATLVVSQASDDERLTGPSGDRPARLDISDRFGPLFIGRTAYSAPSAIPDELSVQFTSGVGGCAKVVARTVENLIDELDAVSSQIALSDRDATVCPCPLFHAYGFVNGLLLPFFSGRPAILVDWFLPNVIVDIVKEWKAAVFVGVPAMYKALAGAHGATAVDLAPLRFCFSAGAPIADNIAGSFRARYGLSVRQLYGTTETGVISIDLDREGERSSYVGRPLPGRRIEIVGEDGTAVRAGESGEIVVHSPSAARGYIDDDPLSARMFRDGAYVTGDLGYFDGPGLVLRGRRTAFINVAGFKVDPLEIEHVLATFDAVAECSVVSHRDPASGEAVRAVVVAKRAVSEQEVQQFCRRQLAPHKVPRYVTFVDELPRSPTGKVLTKYLTDD
jgi:long-chain acyl-CoA synthetase